MPWWRLATRAGVAPENGRRPEPLFSVFVGYETFAGRMCQMAYGAVVSPGTLVDWLDRSWIERVVFDGPSRVMDLGAATRLFGGEKQGPVSLCVPACYGSEETMIKDFRAFLLRDNVVDLAVAVVIGAAFGAVVTALVQDLVTPLLAIPGKTDFSSLSFTINESRFMYGHFLNVLISFVSIAGAVFFFVVRPVNALMARRKTAPDVESTTKTCEHCLSSIPRAASACAFCTRDVQAA